MDEDRATIGLTPEAIKQLEAIQLKGWFEDAQDAARFAAAYALRAGIKPSVTHGVDTRWAIGGFDKTGEFRSIMAALHPENSMPVRGIEHLTIQGLTLLHDRLVTRGESPADLLD